MLTEAEISNFWNKVDVRLPSECWPWTAGTNAGYGQFEIGNRRDGNRRTVASHRLAFYFANEDQWPENYACHTCNNPICCNPSHLYDGTQQQNMDDMVAAGRQNKAKGENHGRSILTEDQILEIRERYIPRLITQQMLADEYGVNQSLIHQIIHRHIWRHI